MPAFSSAAVSAWAWPRTRADNAVRKRASPSSANATSWSAMALRRPRRPGHSNDWVTPTLQATPSPTKPLPSSVERFCPTLPETSGSACRPEVRRDVRAASSSAS